MRRLLDVSRTAGGDVLRAEGAVVEAQHVLQLLPGQFLVSADYGSGLGYFLIQFDATPKVTIQQQ